LLIFGSALVYIGQVSLEDACVLQMVILIMLFKFFLNLLISTLTSIVIVFTIIALFTYLFLLTVTVLFGERGVIFLLTGKIPRRGGIYRHCYPFLGHAFDG